MTRPPPLPPDFDPDGAASGDGGLFGLPTSPEAARVLRSIAYAPVVSVALGYEQTQMRHPVAGFGFMSPRKEGQRMLGGLFSSNLFAARAPAGRTLVTAFVGGTTDPGALDRDDEASTLEPRADAIRVRSD